MTGRPRIYPIRFADCGKCGKRYRVPCGSTGKYCSWGCFMAVRTNDESDVWKYIDKSDGPSSCWPWTSAVNRDGYGQFRVKRKFWRVTRLIWKVSHGADAPGKLYVLHSCDNPRCCNPGHLRLGTQLENMADMLKRGRRGVRRPPRAKLKECEVALLKRLALRTKLRHADIGRMFRITRPTVSAIASGRTWKNVQPAGICREPTGTPTPPQVPRLKKAGIV